MSKSTLISLYYTPSDYRLLTLCLSKYELYLYFYLVCLCVFSLGYSLCLGKSYFFRFNHPEEASRMKSMLPQKSPVSALAYNTGTNTGSPVNPFLDPCPFFFVPPLCLCSATSPSPLPPPSLFHHLLHLFYLSFQVFSSCSSSSAYSPRKYLLLSPDRDLRIKLQVDTTQTGV